jgi:hypothetical protein
MHKQRSKGDIILRKILSTALIGLVLMVVAFPAAAQAGWTQGQLKTYQMIKVFWPKRYREARRVFWCESHWHKNSLNPYSGAAGVAQLMPFWYDGSNAYGWRFYPFSRYMNLFYAHEIFMRNHKSWGAWVCQP